MRKDKNMNKKNRGFSDNHPAQDTQARHIVEMIEKLGYAVSTDDYRKEITFVASNPAAGRTLISAGEDAYSAIHNMAIVLGLLDEAEEDRTQYVLRSSGR
jgi:hypothetical protein